MVSTKRKKEKYFTTPEGTKIPVATPTTPDAPERLAQTAKANIPSKQDANISARQPNVDTSPEKLVSTAPERLVAPLTKIKIATASGVRTYALREKTLEKYGAIPNRLVDGTKVFARTIPIYYERSGITRRVPVAPEKKPQYFYNEDIQAFVKYVPQAETHIVVENQAGKKETVTVRQEAVREGLYAQKRNEQGKIVKGVYVREKHIVHKKLSQTEAKQTISDGLYPAGVNLTVVFNPVDVYDKDGNMKYTGLRIEGYSHLNRYPRSRDEMFAEAYNYLIHVLMKDYAIASDDSIEYEVEEEHVSRYIS